MWRGRHGRAFAGGRVAIDREVRVGLSYDVPFSWGLIEPPPGGTFHAPRWQSWEKSAFMTGARRANVCAGGATGVHSPGAGWRLIERLGLDRMYVKVQSDVITTTTLAHHIMRVL